MKPVWSVDCATRGLGGVAATKALVIYSERGLNDTSDVWKCVRADDGKPVWTYSYPAPGSLDYGNSPRATPMIDDGRAYLMGAFGHLSCVDFQTGKLIWDLSLRDEFDVTEKTQWGSCSTPLLVDGKLIANPGGPEASLVALEPKTGKILWKSPGKPAGYGSLITGEFGGKKQIVGHDIESLGGWDIATGKRLWRLKPPNPSDFNVPTPMRHGNQLLITTENNGTRLFSFATDGRIESKPFAQNNKLNPDTHSPVVVGDRIFGVWRRLFCLDIKSRLKPVGEIDDQVFTKYTTLVASDTRLLAMTLDAEFLLYDITADQPRELSRTKALAGEKGLYSHPAFVGTRAYVRGSSSLVCLELK